MSYNYVLSLCSRKLLKPNRNLVSNLIPTWWCILKIYFSKGLVNFIRTFMKETIANFGVDFGPVIYNTLKKGIYKVFILARKLFQSVLWHFIWISRQKPHLQGEIFVKGTQLTIYGELGTLK